MSGVRIPPRPQPSPFGRTYPSGDRKIMIGIADPKLWNLGVGLLSKWNGPYLFLRVIVNKAFFKYSMPRPPAGSILFCFTSRNSSSARLGQNSRASTSISSIAKKRSSSLICFMFARGNCSLSGESMTPSLMHS